MRYASLALLLLGLCTAAVAARAGADPSDPPPFACPTGTEPRLRASNAPRSSLTGALYLVHTEQWCASPGTDGEARYGPYRALDRDGNWIERGDYEAVRRNGVTDRRIGPWRHRTPGDCGDWVDWGSWPGPVRPTREQSQAVASRAIAASRHAECGKERRSVGTQSGPGLLDRATEPQVALSKICLAQDGAQDGPTWTWFAHGGLRSEDHYAEGVRNGVFRAWHSNGRPRWEGSFRQGREQGLWRAFDCDGVLRCEGHAEGGRIAGAWRCASGEPPPLVDWLGELGVPPPRPPGR